MFLSPVLLTRDRGLLCLPMPPKRKKTLPSSQPIAEDGAVSSQMKRPRADQLFDAEFAPLAGGFV